ncbi:MAG TPA: TolC family protein [Nannocystis exedens]|nr:TolC family protein [Nannocystis exedens]
MTITMFRPKMPVVAGATLSMILGCASVHPDKPRGELGELIQERAGASDVISEREDQESLDRVRERVDDLIAEPLTVERAIQVGLLNNRRYLATIEELGVAQADLVQAGLLENPVLAGDLVNSTKGNGLGGGLSLTTSLLSVFLIPAKRRLAKSQLAHAVVSAGQASLVLVRDVHAAYAAAQAAAAVLDLQREQTQAAELAAELAELQFDAGNVSDLDVQLFAAALDAAKVALADAQTADRVAHEELGHLLGLWGARASWTLAPRVVELPPPPRLDDLEQRGIRERLDLSAERAVVKSIELALELRRRGLVPNVEIGGEARNEVGDDAGHEWVLGPSLSVELPIFDPGHADFARLRAQLRQAQHNLQGAAVEARSEIRIQKAKFIAAQEKVSFYREIILPRAATIAVQTMKRYNAMLVGTYQVLEARTHQVESEREFVEALRDYWVARSNLELAIGGQLKESSAAAEEQ